MDSEERKSSYLSTIVELRNLVGSMNGKRPLVGDVRLCQECDRLYEYRKLFGLPEGICSRKCLGVLAARRRGTIFVPYVGPKSRELIAKGKSDKQAEYLRLRMLARQRGRESLRDLESRKNDVPVVGLRRRGRPVEDPIRDPMGTRLQEAFLAWEADRARREEENKHKHWKGA